MKEIIFTAKDSKKIFCSLWDNVKKPIGVVQLIHGMNEYVNRYDRFAKYLNKNGFIVFGDDHRAHGRTASSIDKIGTTDGNKDLFNAIMNDELEILNYLNKKYKLPIMLFGHSYGSFITQVIIEKTNIHKAVCLCGSAKFWQIYLFIGLLIAWMGQSLCGKDAPANIIEKFSPTRNKKNGTSRLTRDLKQAKKFQNNKYFKGKFSYGFYYSLFKNLFYFRRGKLSKKIPMLIISGGKDSVSFDGLLAKHLYNTYKKIGVKNLSIKIYPSAKHELLNELNYTKAQKDILSFFLQSLIVSDISNI